MLPRLLPQIRTCKPTFASTRLFSAASASAPPPPPPTQSAFGKFVSIAGPFALGYAGYYYYQKNYAPVSTQTEKASITTALDPKVFKDFTLVSTSPVSHNTSLFRFALPEKDQTLGSSVASCILTKTTGPDGKPIIRPYTPISPDDTQGHFDLVIKHYNDGAMSSHIHSLRVGDSLSIKGPISKYPLERNQHTEIGLIAGGTGITPMLQIIRKVLADPSDTTKISLVFANITEDDILLRGELDDLAKKHADRFCVHYTLDKAPADKASWTGGIGYVDEERIAKYMPPPGKGKVFVCGPPPMIKALAGPKDGFKQGDLSGLLKTTGYTSDDVFKF